MTENTQRTNGLKEEGLPEGLYVQLSFLSGPDRGMVKKLWKKDTVLGRADSDIIITDRAASKQHAKISFENNGLVLRDLGSTNGTLLNGGRVWEAALGNLDELTIGETVIQVTILEAAGEDAAAGEGTGPGAVEVESVPGTETTRPRKARVEPDPLADPLPEGVKAVLQVAGGPDAGSRFEIKSRATLIGRAGADLALQDQDASRKHCSIEFIGRDKVILKDLRSRNGTYLNNRRVTVANLKNGDSIQVGDTVLNFFISLRSDK
ncbi:MAG TPA: FHA domain-containing protein [bacterium]|nr:FHA domain-containing protein [bacterium]